MMESMNSSNDSNMISKYLYEIRNKIEQFKKFNIDKNIIEELLTKVSSLESEVNKNCVDIILLGNLNSGKTSLLNALIAIIIKNYDTPLLPTSISENTFCITTIENSDDKYFHAEYLKNGVISTHKTFNTLEELSDNLDKWDYASSDYLYSIKKFEFEKDNEAGINKGEEEEIPDIQVKIKIPNFWKKIRLIDTPGLTSQIFKDRLIKSLENSLFPIFIFVRSLIQPQVIETVTTSIFTYLKQNFKQGLIILSLSKKDLLIEEIEGTDSKIKKQLGKFRAIEQNRNIRKYLNNLKNFFNFISEIEITEGFQFDKIAILNPRRVLERDEVSKKEMQNFVLYLKSLPFTKGEKVKLAYCKFKLNNLIDELNNKFLRIKNEEIELLKGSSKKTEDIVKSWIESRKNYKDFRKKHNLQLERIHKKFIEVDKNVLGKYKYWNRNIYIDDQFKQLSNDFNKLVISDIQDSIFIFYSKFLSELSNENMIELKKNIRNLIEESFTQFMNKTRVIHSADIYFGMWIRLNCWEDLVEYYHKFLFQSKNAIVHNFSKKYQAMIENLIQQNIQFSNLIESIFSISKNSLLENYDAKYNFGVLLYEAVNDTINEFQITPVRKFLEKCLENNS